MLRDEMRVAVRVMSTMTDSEIDANIAAAKSHMKQMGVREELLEDKTMDGLVKQAIIEFCKASYGLENSQRSDYFDRYIWAVTSLMNSSKNESLYEDVE